MKINNYIITSLIFHLLLFSVLIILHREIDTGVSLRIFDVNIVGPIEERIEHKITKENLPSPSSYTRKSAPKNLSDTIPPKTMFGEGTDSTNYGEKVPSQHSPEMLNNSSHNAEPAPSKKESALPEGTKGLPLKPKSFLFDKETIEMHAKKGDVGKKDLTFDVPEFHHRGYMKMLKDKIESIWKYPKEAAVRGIYGDLYIRFSIKKNGALGDVELVRTSGYNDLDEAAMKALKDSEPYWPLPDDWKGDELSILGHFIYIMGSGYIM